MTARALPLYLFALALALVVAAACGGGGDGEQPTGRLTDPRSVATATPWAEAPEPIILEPGALTPISDGGDGGDGNTEVAVTPVTPFQITSDESTNRRAAPSTDAAISGTIKAGDEATVTGRATGEELESGNNVWYELEDGSFVYSGAVKKVE